MYNAKISKVLRSLHHSYRSHTMEKTTDEAFALCCCCADTCGIFEKTHGILIRMIGTEHHPGGSETPNGFGLLVITCACIKAVVEGALHR